MNWRRFCLVAIAALLFPLLAHAGDCGRVIKVLLHVLDAKGRHTLAPSLFDRDAYQVRLRENPNLRSGIRFDIQWKAKRSADGHLKLLVEMRGANNNAITTQILEQPVARKGLFTTWSSLTLSGKEYKQLGDMVAWKVSLLEGDSELASQKSFLW